MRVRVLVSRITLLALLTGLGALRVVQAQTQPPVIADDPNTQVRTWANSRAHAFIGYDSARYGDWGFGSVQGDPLWDLDDIDPTGTGTAAKKYWCSFIERGFAYLYVPELEKEFEIGRNGAMERSPWVDTRTQTAGFTWNTNDDEVDVSVVFEIKLVRDVLRWKYTIINHTGRSIRLGYRVVENVNFFPAVAGTLVDVGPYWVTNGTAQQTVQEYKNGAVPNEWFIRYNPGNGPAPAPDYRTVMKMRQIFTGTATRPERLVFAERAKAIAYGWDTVDSLSDPNASTANLLNIGAGINTDLAVSMFYPLQYAGPGSNRTISGELQMNWAQVSALTNQALAVYAPDWIGFRSGDNPATTSTVENGYFAPDRIRVRAYVSNAHMLMSPDVSISITPDPGLMLVPGQSRSYTNIKLIGITDQLCERVPGDNYSWELMPTGTVSGLIAIRVTATFSPGGTVTTTQYVNVPALPQRTYQGGDRLWHFVGFPFTFANANPTAALGIPFWTTPQLSQNLWWWDPSIVEDSKYRSAANGEVTLQPGKGYWLKLASQQTISLRGATELDQRTAHTTELQRGWNAISSPFLFSINLGRCSVFYNYQEYTIAEAIRMGLIRTETYAWDNTVGYIISSVLSTEMRPYQGYWIYANSPVSLVYTPNPFVPAMDIDTPGARSRGRAAGDTNNWQVNLIVQAGEAKDAFTSFGVAPDEQVGPSAGDLMKPPHSPLGLSAYFPRAEWGRASGSYAVDMQAPVAENRWTLDVRCDQPNTEVTVRWPDLVQGPPKAHMVLTDELTGRQIYLRTTPYYSFNSGTGGVRRFTITVGGTLERLQFTQAMAGTSRGPAGVAVTYGLTVPADVTMRLRTPTGRLVRASTPTRAAGGISTLFWDGKDGRGQAVPAGMYLCELSAQAPDGQRVRTVVTITLQK